ncbi:MAG: hypothetical protein RIM33_13660 [Alphaproteobacteria bacterium]
MRDRLETGARLSIYLQPDHDTLETDGPEYNEAYGLPFVFAEGDAIAGQTRPGHMFRYPDGGFSMASFCYMTALPCYSIIYPNSADTKEGTIGTKLMSLRQYRHAEFRLKEPGRLIFEFSPEEHEVPTDGGLRQSLIDGHSHYAVVDFGDSRFWSLPIDIVYDFYDESRVEFRTECFLTSSHVVAPGAFRDGVRAGRNAEAALENPAFSMSRTFPVMTTYLCLHGDGTYCDQSMEQRAEVKPYRHLRVFELP